MSGSLEFQQLQLAEELASIRQNRESLQQQEVNTMDAEKSSRKQPVTRSRVRGSGLRSVSAAYDGGRPILDKPVIDEITMLKSKSIVSKLQFEGTDTDIVEGLRLTVKNDVNIIREEANGAVDRTKELYCGERGKVSKIYNMLDSCGVDISFPDGETRFFTLKCLEPPVQKKAAPLPRVAAIPQKEVAEKTQQVPQQKPKTTQPISKTAPQQQSTPKPSSSKVTVGDLISITLGGKVVQNCIVRFVGSTDFAPGSWVGLELPVPEGKNNGTVSGVQYYQCADGYGLFRREAELQGNGKEKSESTSAPKKPPAKRAVKSSIRTVTPALQCLTKTVRLWENGQYGSSVDTVPFKCMVIRPVHKTLKSVLNTATRELGWHILKRSVDVLYLEDGTEVTEINQIVDGANIVASWGDAFVVPDSPLPRQKSSKTTTTTATASSHEDPMASVSSTPAKYGAPVANNSVTPQKTVTAVRKTPTQVTHKTVKVFENGCYGSSWSETVSSYTVTIRPNFKTIASVKTMIARELSWNKQGRKVEILFDTLGEEITDPSVISNGDTIIASAGDNYIKPHKEVGDRLPPPASKADSIQPNSTQQVQSKERVKSASPLQTKSITTIEEPPQPSDSSSPARRFLHDLQQEMAEEEEAYVRNIGSNELPVESDTSSDEEEDVGGKPKSNMDRIARLMAEIAELEA